MSLFRYKPLPKRGNGKVPVAPLIPFDPDACDKYPDPPVWR